MSGSQTSLHRQALEAFEQQVRERFGDTIAALYLFGSVARDDERGLDSDIDLLVVLRDDVDRADAESAIRDVAYDVELEYGIVLSLLVRSESEYDRQKDHPFFRQARRDAEQLYG